MFFQNSISRDSRVARFATLLAAILMVWCVGIGSSQPVFAGGPPDFEPGWSVNSNPEFIGKVINANPGDEVPIMSILVSARDDVLEHHVDFISLRYAGLGDIGDLIFPQECVVDLIGKVDYQGLNIAIPSGETSKITLFAKIADWASAGQHSFDIASCYDIEFLEPPQGRPIGGSFPIAGHIVSVQPQTTMVISVSSHTPPSQNVLAGAKMFTVTRNEIKVSGGREVLERVAIQRKGLSLDSDIERVFFYDITFGQPGILLGSGILNDGVLELDFAEDAPSPIDIKDGETKKFETRVSVSRDALVGSQFKFGIIRVRTTADMVQMPVGGAWGNKMTVEFPLPSVSLTPSRGHATVGDSVELELWLNDVNPGLGIWAVWIGISYPENLLGYRGAHLAKRNEDWQGWIWEGGGELDFILWSPEEILENPDELIAQISFEALAQGQADVEIDFGVIFTDDWNCEELSDFSSSWISIWAPRPTIDLELNKKVFYPGDVIKVYAAIENPRDELLEAKIYCTFQIGFRRIRFIRKVKVKAESVREINLLRARIPKKPESDIGWVFVIMEDQEGSLCSFDWEVFRIMPRPTPPPIPEPEEPDEEPIDIEGPSYGSGSGAYKQ